MSWPQNPSSPLQSNWLIEDGASLFVARRFIIGLGCKMLIGSGSVLKIV